MSFRATRSAAFAAIAAAGAYLASAQSTALDEIVVTADFRETRIEDLPVSVSVLDATSSSDDAAALRGSDPPYSEPESLGRRLASALLSAPGCRRARAVRRRAESVDWIHRRRHRFFGARQHRHAVRHRPRRGPAWAARHALRRERARRARLHARASAVDRARGRFRGDDGQRRHLRLGGAFGGPLGDALGFRASVHGYENDGFRDNAFLGRDDTYGRDELTARGKLAWSRATTCRWTSRASTSTSTTVTTRGLSTTPDYVLRRPRP